MVISLLGGVDSILHKAISTPVEMLARNPKA